MRCLPDAQDRLRWRVRNWRKDFPTQLAVGDPNHNLVALIPEKPDCKMLFELARTCSAEFFAYPLVRSLMDELLQRTNDYVASGGNLCADAKTQRVSILALVSLYEQHLHQMTEQRQLEEALLQHHIAAQQQVEEAHEQAMRGVVYHWYWPVLNHALAHPILPDHAGGCPDSTSPFSSCSFCHQPWFEAAVRRFRTVFRLLDITRASLIEHTAPDGSLSMDLQRFLIEELDEDAGQFVTESVAAIVANGFWPNTAPRVEVVPPDPSSLQDELDVIARDSVILAWDLSRFSPQPLAPPPPPVTPDVAPQSPMVVLQQPGLFVDPSSPESGAEFLA